MPTRQRRSDEAPAGSCARSYLKEGTGYPVYATEACPLTIEGGDGDSAVLVFARATDGPVFAAGQLIGRGRIACLGALVYSSFDLRRDMFANSQFTLALMAWLGGGGG